MIIAALVVLVVVAGGIVFLLKRHTATPPAKAVTVSHTFAARQFGTISVSKVWQLSGKTGSTLTATITVHNTTSRTVNAVFSEPVPAAVAANPQSPHYTPSPAHISTSTRVVEWKLSIPAGATSDLGYSVQIDKPASNSELNSLVAGFNAVASHENLSVIQASLKSLTVTPSKLKLTVGHAGHLRLRGTLSNGAPATTAMLSMAHWTTANAAIAKVSDGKVTAVGAGTTRIIARIGSVKVSVVVTVAPASNPAPTYTPPPATYSPPANTPTPQPSGTPTATI